MKLMATEMMHMDWKTNFGWFLQRRKAKRKKIKKKCFQALYQYNYCYFSLLFCQKKEKFFLIRVFF